jgi:hypothetical protein
MRSVFPLFLRPGFHDGGHPLDLNPVYTFPVGGKSIPVLGTEGRPDELLLSPPRGWSSVTWLGADPSSAERRRIIAALTFLYVLC